MLVFFSSSGFHVKVENGEEWAWERVEGKRNMTEPGALGITACRKHFCHHFLFFDLSPWRRRKTEFDGKAEQTGRRERFG